MGGGGGLAVRLPPLHSRLPTLQPPARVPHRPPLPREDAHERMHARRLYPLPITTAHLKERESGRESERASERARERESERERERERESERERERARERDASPLVPPSVACSRRTMAYPSAARRRGLETSLHRGIFGERMRF